MGIAPGAACYLFVFYNIQLKHYVQSRVSNL